MIRERIRGSPLIAVVGPCGSGKTTLIELLKAQGYDARQIAQEHSHVPSMWEQITNPDLLIYLNATFETCTDRKNLNWTLKEYRTQVERLSHAREHCDIYIDTEQKTTSEIALIALEFLRDFTSKSD